MAEGGYGMGLMKLDRRDECGGLAQRGLSTCSCLLVAAVSCLTWGGGVLMAQVASSGAKSGSSKLEAATMTGFSDEFMRRLQMDEPEAQYEAAQWCDARDTGIWEGQRAAGWYFLAARQGHAKARHRLGLMCMWGKGVVQNTMQALLWLTLAADELEEAKADLALCESQFQPAVLAAVKEGLLAEMEQGEREEKPEMLPGVPAGGFPLPPSLPAGVSEDCRLLEQAARLGHAPSQYMLGLYANEGVFGEADFELAAAWLRHGCSWRPCRATQEPCSRWRTLSPREGGAGTGATTGA